MKKIGALILTVLVLAFSLTGCGSGFLSESEIMNIENPTGTITIDIYDELNDTAVASSSRTFSFVLYYQDAPNTVANFINLVENGYYNNKVFEQDSGLPFVLLGQKEYIEGETEDEDGEEYDEPLYTKRQVKPAYYIIGEFFRNGYYTGKREDNNPRNTQKSGAGSMMMIREESTENPKSKYNTAYAGFKIQTRASVVPYEEKFCVFGQIVGISSATLEQQLVDYFFEDSGISTVYNNDNHDYKFRIANIEITYPSGVTKDSFKVRKLKA